MTDKNQHSGFTMNACKDPRRRLLKLIDGVKNNDAERKRLKENRRILIAEIKQCIEALPELT